jgi:hypothetical protein
MRAVALALLTLALGSTYALGSPIEANIPFEFTIVDKTFPPADYIFEVAGSNQPSVLGMRAKDGTERTMFDTEQMPEKEDPKVVDLVFDKMGDKTYLMEVWGLTDSGRAVKHTVDGKPLEIAKEASRQHLTAIRVVDK